MRLSLTALFEKCKSKNFHVIAYVNDVDESFVDVYAFVYDSYIYQRTVQRNTYLQEYRNVFNRTGKILLRLPNGQYLTN